MLGIAAADEVMGVRARGRIVPGPLYFGLMTSQFSLTVLWLCLGRRWFSIRFAAVIATAVMWSWLCSRSAEQRYNDSIVAFSVLGTILATSLLVLRLAGIWLAIPGQHEKPTAQFSLRDAFVWMVVFAVVAMTGRYIENWTSLRYFVAVCAPIAITCLAVTWALFNTRRFFGRLVAAVLVALLSAIGSMSLLGTVTRESLQRTVIEFCILSASLWLFRALGYRLVSSRRQSGLRQATKSVT
jgi:hypothetical protein